MKKLVPIALVIFGGWLLFHLASKKMKQSAGTAAGGKK